MFILEFVYRLFPVHYFLYIRSRSSADRYVQQSWSQISRKGRDEGKLFFRPFSWVLARLNLTPIFSHPRKRWIATGYESTETAGDSSGFSTAHSQVRVGDLKTKTATCNYPEPSSLCKVGETFLKKDAITERLIELLSHLSNSNGYVANPPSMWEIFDFESGFSLVLRYSSLPASEAGKKSHGVCIDS